MNRLASTGAWATLDQGLFAASNFLVNLMLARTLSPAGFGSFAFAFSILVLLGTLHSALLTEPMLVLGAGRYRDRLAAYFNILLTNHVLLTAAMSIGLLLAAAVLKLWGSPSLAVVLMALAATCPCVLFLWLMRRSCYLRLGPRVAASAGFLYLALVVAGLAVASRYELTSPAAALLIIAFASLVCGLWIAMRQGLRGFVRERDLPADVRKQHWAYGRYSVRTAILAWVPGNIYFLALPFFGAVHEAAAFRAVLMTLMPMLLTQAAMGLILVPMVAQAETVERVRLVVRNAALGTAVASAAYGILLAVNGDHVVQLAFHGRYDAIAPLLFFAAMIVVTEGHATMTAGALRGLLLPERVAGAAGIAAGTAVIGLGLAWHWGAAGAVTGWLLSSFVFALTLHRTLRNFLSRKPRLQSAAADGSSPRVAAGVDVVLDARST